MVNIRFIPDSTKDTDALSVFLILFPGGGGMFGGDEGGSTPGGVILQENADIILQENGDYILQEAT